MTPSAPHRRSFAAGGLVAAMAAATLTACGPRDGSPLVGGADPGAPQRTTAAAVTDDLATTRSAQAVPARVGSPVPTAQTSTAALAPAPAYAPLPVTVAAAPAYPMQSPIGYALAPQYAPVPAAAPTGSYQDGPPQVRPVPAAAPAAQAPAVPRERIGSVTAIEPVRQRPQGSGAGAVIGGVLGGVIGNNSATASAGRR